MSDHVSLSSSGPNDAVVLVNNIFTGGERCAVRVTGPLPGQFTLSYNAFFGNGSDLDLDEGALPGFGLLSQTNRNGDSTDAYGNLFRDPLFADTLAFTLAPGSPCIDAGLDLDLPFIGAGPDIGWWEDGYTRRPDPAPAASAVPSVRLYPNPANGAAVLDLSGITAPHVEVEVFDLLGRRVLSRSLTPQGGSVRLPLGGPAFASGLYFVRVRTAARQTILPLLLLK